MSEAGKGGLFRNSKNIGMKPIQDIPEYLSYLPKDTFLLGNNIVM